MAKQDFGATRYHPLGPSKCTWLEEQKAMPVQGVMGYLYYSPGFRAYHAAYVKGRAERIRAVSRMTLQAQCDYYRSIGYFSNTGAWRPSSRIACCPRTGSIGVSDD